MGILDPWEFILEWWQDYQADPRSDPNLIESGLKKQQTKSDQQIEYVKPAVTGSLQTAAWQ